MDRAAKLADKAREYLLYEALGAFAPDVARRATRLSLIEDAVAMGLDADKEASAYADEALTAAGATP